MSCVILPMAPTGVMSVSPVARQATMARKKDMTTARMPIHQWMPKNQIWRITAAMPVTITPMANHEPGTSTAASASSWAVVLLAFLNMAARPEKARRTVRHCMKNPNRPAVTIMATPGHMSQRTMLRKPP